MVADGKIFAHPSRWSHLTVDSGGGYRALSVLRLRNGRERDRESPVAFERSTVAMPRVRLFGVRTVTQL